MSPDPSTEKTLEPGIYQIINVAHTKSAIDLSGFDKKAIIAYEIHNGDNQKWEIRRLGAGYSICSVYNGTYITIEQGIVEGANLVANGYPVSWDLEADDFEAGVWRIRWPNSPLVFDNPAEDDIYRIQLSNRYPFHESRLWRFIKTEPNKPDELEFKTAAPQKLHPEPSLVTTADTVIDVEGLRLGGNGEMSITTTTTTTTTSVTVVKRIGVS